MRKKLLCALPWICISEDSVVDANQIEKVLWVKVVNKFNENSNTNRKEVGSVYNLWKVINKAWTL